MLYGVRYNPYSATFDMFVLQIVENEFIPLFGIVCAIYAFYLL